MRTASQIVRNLDSGEIRRRLADIEGERKALMTLLRAALAREIAEARRDHKEDHGRA